MAIHHPLTTGALVMLFWLIAAVLVVTVHGGAVATIGAILVAAYGYTRLVAHRAGVTHALGVGIAWLVLSIVVEMVVATCLGHGCSSLLGSPARPLLRNVLLFAWIFAPAVFARGDE